MPHEYQNASGQIVLDYAKATQESVFEQLRVVRDGQLRIVFSPDLKICSWEFCARSHEELTPSRSVVPKVSHHGAAAQKYQATAQNASSNSSRKKLQCKTNMFLASARQLAKGLEVPLVNDLGYTKRYARSLQISEVVNSMIDLIDFRKETGKGPMDCLAKFPRRTISVSGVHNSSLQPEQQQKVITVQNLNGGNNSAQATPMQLSECNGAGNVNNSHGTTSTINTAASTVEILRRNCITSRHESQINNPNSPCVGTPVQIPSTGFSTTPPPNQPNLYSPFSSSTPSSSKNLPQTSHSAFAASAPSNHIDSAHLPSNIPLHQSPQSNGTDSNEPQSTVERIIQQIMNSSQFGGASNTIGIGAVGNSVKNINGMTQTSKNSISSGSCPVANGVANNNSGNGRHGNGHSGGGTGLSASTSEIRTSMGNKSATLTRLVGVPLTPQDTSMINQRPEPNNELT